MPLILRDCELFYDEVPAVLRHHQQMVHNSGHALPQKNRKGVLKTDSRAIHPGDIFLAYKGVNSDGHQHLTEAIARNAGFLIVEDETSLIGLSSGQTPPWVKVTNGRIAWSLLASHAFDHPEDHLDLLAVTGTNGKTSTVWLTAQILDSCGIPCMSLGTLGARYGDLHYETNHTTPDPDILYGLLDWARRQEVQVVAMEASSHSLVQEKLYGLKFAACAFTSFSRDHLDFHKTMENYWEAKWRLFTEHTRPGASLIFSDTLPDLRTRGLNGQVIVYGFDPERQAKKWGADDFWRLESQVDETLQSHVTFASKSENVSAMTPFFAPHSIENLAAALLLAKALTGSMPVSSKLSGLKPIPGRLEAVTTGQGPQVIVDYAHTPDALEKTLKVLRGFCRGRLITVFGCGGDRDPGKRPLMAAVAESLSDLVIVTSDNPRTEDPWSIIEQISQGFSDPTLLEQVVDRATAIRRAVAMAGPRDLVLIAGKGHETYQIMGTTRLPFDDRAEAREALAQKAGCS